MITGFRPSGAIGRVTLDTDASRLAEQPGEKYFLTPHDLRRYKFAPSYFALFSAENAHLPKSVLALRALHCCTLEEQARLPMFEGAASSYAKIVENALTKKMLEIGDNPELLKTKRIIIRLAMRHDYRDVVLCPGAILSHLDLSNLVLTGVNLAGSTCFRTNFAGSNLTGANFGGSDLRQASLRGANLTNANLQDCKLKGTNLVGVNLSSLANEEYTDFREATTERCEELRDCCVIS